MQRYLLALEASAASVSFCSATSPFRRIAEVEIVVNAKFLLKESLDSKPLKSLIAKRISALGGNCADAMHEWQRPDWSQLPEFRAANGKAGYETDKRPEKHEDSRPQASPVDFVFCHKFPLRGCV